MDCLSLPCQLAHTYRKLPNGCYLCLRDWYHCMKGCINTKSEITMKKHPIGYNYCHVKVSTKWVIVASYLSSQYVRVEKRVWCKLGTPLLSFLNNMKVTFKCGLPCSSRILPLKLLAWIWKAINCGYTLSVLELELRYCSAFSVMPRGHLICRGRGLWTKSLVDSSTHFAKGKSFQSSFRFMTVS